jgi:hypothetical protein
MFSRSAAGVREHGAALARTFGVAAKRNVV